MSIYYPDYTQAYQRRMCPICRKVFCIPQLDAWRYKRIGRKSLGNYGKAMYFDKYSCLREFDKLYPPKRRKIDNMDEYAI